MNRSHMLSTVAAGLALAMVSCRQPEPAVVRATAPACGTGQCSRPSPPPIPEGAKVAANALAEALRASDWEKALSNCSKRVREAAREYKTPGLFFETVVPMEKMRERLDVGIHGRMGGSNYGGFVLVSPGEAGRELRWSYYMDKTEGVWRVDFMTMPLDEWIHRAVTREQREAPGGLPWDAHAVMLSFQEALRQEAWADALSSCSSDVNAAARDYASPAVFFQEVVPVERLVKMSSFPVWMGRSTGGQKTLCGCFLRLTEPGERPGVDWTWELERAGDGWIIGFKTIPLQRWIQEETVRQERESAKLAAMRKIAETMVTGVRTHLTAVSEDFVLGQPMLFRLELINEGTANLEYDDQQAAVNESMTITDEQGQLVPYVASECQTGGVNRPLGPGETIVIFDKLDIAGQYEIVKPGKYKVQFNGKGLSVGAEVGDGAKPRSVGVGRSFPSNTVEIEVKAGAAS